MGLWKGLWRGLWMGPVELWKRCGKGSMAAYQPAAAAA